MKKQYTNEELVLLSLPYECCNENWKIDKEKVLQNVNWRALFIFAKKNNLNNLVYLTLGDYIPEKYKSFFFKEYCSDMKRNDALAMALKEIYQGADIPFNIVLNKGFALSKVLYDDIYLRNVSDVDLIVEENNIRQTDQWFRQNGYVVYYYENGKRQFVNEISFKSNTIVPKEGNEKYITVDGHELHPYNKMINDISVEVEVARYLHVIHERIDNFFNNLITTKIGDIEVKCFDEVHMFLALVDHAFENSETNSGLFNRSSCIRDYIDIFVFLRKKINNELFDQVIQRSAEYGFILELQRVMRNLYCIFSDRQFKQYNNRIYQEVQKLGNDVECGSYLIPWDSDFRERVFNMTQALVEFYAIIDRDRVEDTTNYIDITKIKL